MHQIVASEVDSRVSFRLEHRIGEGGMALAFLATRIGPDGETPVVLKVVRPNIVASATAMASMVIQKEAVALGRLNERVPPTPFVVRLIDAGCAYLNGPEHLPLPWLALEYVHGGVEGTTLTERVEYSCRNTGFAFDPGRAAHLARCLASGLGAIHAVGVIHRDLTPGNVLCCGFGETEIFKISDFGIARPQGLQATFGNSTPGTPGYAAPEQSLPGPIPLGTYSDVFSLACIIYFVLTGEMYFDERSPIAVIMSIRGPHRRSIRDGRWLSPELRERSDACAAIDHALARATADDPRTRPDQAQELTATIVPWLTQGSKAPRPSARLLDSVHNRAPRSDVSAWRWSVRYPPGGERVVQSAAWDVDGHCLVTTTEGTSFWTGQTWVDQLPSEMQLPVGMRFATRQGAGSWLVGGASGLLAVVASGGLQEHLRCPEERVTFTHASGQFDDLLAAVGEEPGQPPTLWTMTARRWIKPLRLPGVAYVAKLLPLDEARWVICGRLADGGGFAAIYTPLFWEVTFLLVPRTRALVAGASDPARKLALVVGSQGVAVRVEDNRADTSVIEGAPDLTAAAMDVVGREWVASIGGLWMRDPRRGLPWRTVWRDPGWRTPIVSLMADEGIVVAMTADGGIVEGRG
jgi:serine/threonine protein kinase